MSASNRTSISSKLMAGYLWWRRTTLRHPRVYGYICLPAGLWLLFLGTVMCSYGIWWGAALIAAGALDLRLAWWLLSAATRDASAASPHPQH